jgi:hypothetical protein
MFWLSLSLVLGYSPSNLLSSTNSRSLSDYRNLTSTPKPHNLVVFCRAQSSEYATKCQLIY